MSATLYGMDVVAVRLFKRRVAVGVLQTDLRLYHARETLALALEVYDGRKRLLVRVKELNELVDAAVVVERLLVVGVALVVPEVYRDTSVEEGQLPQACAKRLPLEGMTAENRVVREERHLGAGLHAAFAHDLERLRNMPARELYAVQPAAALDLDLHPLGKRVNAAYANTVQTARHLVVGPVELAACVQNCQNDLDSRLLLRRVHVDRNASPVVLDSQRAVAVYHDVDHRAVSSQRLVNGVVHHFVDQMVVAALPRVAYVHGRTLSYGLHALQYLDVLCVVVVDFVVSHCFSVL